MRTAGHYTTPKQCSNSICSGELDALDKVFPREQLGSMELSKPVSRSPHLGLCILKLKAHAKNIIQKCPLYDMLNT